METTFKGKKVEISRFKGLGEMPARLLKETTMNPKSRILLRVTLPSAMSVLGLSENLDNDLEESGEDSLESAPSALAEVDDLVDRLMGKNAEPRFRFIQDNAEFAADIDV